MKTSVNYLSSSSEESLFFSNQEIDFSSHFLEVYSIENNPLKYCDPNNEVSSKKRFR